MNKKDHAGPGYSGAGRSPEALQALTEEMAVLEAECRCGPPRPDDPDAWIGHPENLPDTANACCIAAGCEVGDRSAEQGCCSPIGPSGGVL